MSNFVETWKGIATALGRSERWCRYMARKAGDPLPVFKVGGKMFCLIAPPEHSVARISFKCAPEHYDALSRSEGFRPAPYLARAKWVALDDPKVLSPAETKAYLKRAHAVIAGALPRKKRAELGF